MQISEKIKFLMEITNTSNIQLAKAISVDPSLVSRIKNGSRRITESSQYLDGMSRYLASKLINTQTENELPEVSKMGPQCNEDLGDVIRLWLLSEDSDCPEPQQFFWPFVASGINFITPHNCHITPDSQPICASRTLFFFGKDHLSTAGDLFLSIITEKPRQLNMKLLTQGNLDWAFSNRQNMQKMNFCLSYVLENGGNITRIIPNTYTFSSASESIKNWLPLYYTGMVDSFYYPGLNDNIFNINMYIASGTAAICSCTVGMDSDEMCVLVTTEPEAVKSIELMFDNYLKLCLPATKVYHCPHDTPQIFRCLDEFFATPGECICVSNTLPFFTTPLTNFEQLGRTVGAAKVNETLRLCKRRVSQIREITKTHKFYDVFMLPSVEDIISCSLPCRAFQMIHAEYKTYQNPDQYLLHLQAELELLENNPNYNVVLSEQDLSHKTIYTKNCDQVIIISDQNPSSVCSVCYEKLSCTVWHYEYNSIKDLVLDPLYRDSVIKKIRNRILEISLLCSLSSDTN